MVCSVHLSVACNHNRRQASRTLMEWQTGFPFAASILIAVKLDPAPGNLYSYISAIALALSQLCFDRTDQ